MDASRPVPSSASGPTSPLGSSSKKTVFLRRRVESGAPLPSTALTAEQVEAKLQARLEADRERRDQQQKAQQALYEHLQAEEEAEAQAAASRSATPASPARRALLIKKMPPSPMRVQAQPLSLALPDALGVGPGSPGWRGPAVANDAPWSVLGSPARFREIRARNAEAASRDNDESEQPDAAEEKYPSSSEFAPAQVQGSSTANSLSLAHRLTSDLGLGPRRSQIAPPPRGAGANKSSVGKTWQHSEFLSAKKAAQSRAIASLVSNAVYTAEQALVARGLPTTNVSALDALAIRGTDLFDVADTDEASWYAARQRGGGGGGLTARSAAAAVAAEEEEAQERARAAEAARAAKQARARKAALAAAPFDAPVSGPSLVLSSSRLFFPLRCGPVASVVEDATREDSSLASSATSIPGVADRVSRSVTLVNNGTTAVAYEWKAQIGALEAAAKEEARQRGENAAASSTSKDGVDPLAPLPAPTLSSASPLDFFTASVPRGTLLPGERAQVHFTFAPSSEARGLFVQRLELVTVPRLSRPLTELTHLAQRDASAAGEPNENGESDAAALTLTGSVAAVDTGSVARGALYDQVVAWTNRHIAAAHLHHTAAAVRDPPPPPEQHRAIFYTRNRDLRLFYYEELMPEWRQLARDTFARQKRYDRRTLEWDYSATTLRAWIEAVPPRNAAARPELIERYDRLVEQCRVRPAPHAQRYEVAYGLLSSLASSIPRLALRFGLEHGTTTPLEQDARRAAEEARKREDEAAKARMPFHLRGHGAAANSTNLTPEQRRVREEEESLKALAAASQAAEDARKRAEREMSLEKVSEALKSEVKTQLTDALAYFDFLAAPQNTNLDPQAMHVERSVAEAMQNVETTTTTLDIAILTRAQSIGAGAGGVSDHAHAPSSGKNTSRAEKDKDRPRSGKKKDHVSGGAAVEATTKKQVSYTPEGSRPTTPSLRAMPGPVLTATQDVSSLSLVSPRLLTAVELEQMRGQALVEFLATERARRSGTSTTSVRQRIVYFGNGYVTPDTGVHIPTPAEVKLKEERERMARYGQVVPAAVREAEERRIRDMHPMASLAGRQILRTAASAFFSIACTREHGVYAWAAVDAAEPTDELGLATLEKKKSSGSGSGAAKGTGRTRVQEARRGVLAVVAPAAAAGAAGSSSKSDKTPIKGDAKESKSGKASPRSSISGKSGGSGGGGSGSNKKTSSATSTNNSRPGSGQQSTRSGSPVPGAGATLPTALASLGSLTLAGGSAPLPVYIPELQGLDIVSVAAGVHVALLVTRLGSLLAWEHASRRISVLSDHAWPAARDLAVHRQTVAAIQAQQARDRALEAAGVVLADLKTPSRPASGATTRRGGANGASGGGDTARSRKEPTAKLSARKLAKAAASGGGGGVGSGRSESEVLAIDSALEAAEALRQDRLARDADFRTSDKKVATVVIGGSGTLAAGVHYATAAGEFEFALLLTEDGCVYSSLLTSQAALLDAVAVKGASGTSKVAKDREQGTAMLGLGEKTKETSKGDKASAAAAAAAAAEAATTASSPIAHFELVATLHPANLAAGVRVVEISAGYGHATARCSDGSVYVWGLEGPHLGLGADKDAKKARAIPTLLTALRHIALPVAGAATAAAATADESATAPSPSTKGKDRPASGPKETHMSARSAARAAAAAAAAAGSKKVESESGLVEADASGPSDPIISVVCGAFHTLALTASGAVFAWGRNAEAQLGFADLRDRETPTLVAAISPSHNPAALVEALEKANAPPPKQAPPSRLGVTSAAAAAAAAAAVEAASSSSTANAAAGVLSPFLKVVQLAAGGAHSVAVVEPLPSATLVDADGNTRQLARGGLLAWGQNAAGATGHGHVDETPSTPATLVGYFDGQTVRDLTAAGDCTQAVVERQASGTISLVADEDDLPDAVLLD